MSNATTTAEIAELRDKLTDKQFKLATAILEGKKPSEAQVIAGYTKASTVSQALAKRNVAKYISLCRVKAENNAVMTREDVLKTLSEIAKGSGRFEHSTGSEVTGALREVSRISGFYEPEKQDITGSLVDRIRKARDK